MLHAERLRLADELSRKVASAHRKDVRSILLCGSTSKGQDRGFSDLELLIVSSRKLPVKVFQYEGIVVELIFVKQDDLSKALSDPRAEGWFGWAGLLSGARVLYGSEDVLESMRRELSAIPAGLYKDAASEKLVRMLEMLNHVRNARAQKDLASAVSYGLYFRNVVAEFVALISGSHYTNHVFKSVREAEKFKLLPEGYFSELETLGTSRNLEALESASERLYRSSCRLAKENAVRAEPCSSISALRL